MAKITITEQRDVSIKELEHLKQVAEMKLADLKETKKNINTYIAEAQARVDKYTQLYEANKVEEAVDPFEGLPKDTNLFKNR